MAFGYKTAAPGQQFVTDVVWIQNPNHSLARRTVDGLEPLARRPLDVPHPAGHPALLDFHSEERERAISHSCCFLEFGLIGVFSSLDLIVYYGFWELTLVPMVLFIGMWGGEGRVSAALESSFSIRLRALF